MSKARLKNFIQPAYNWTFGTSRLILTGDPFDRGKQVSQFLWLLYKLKDEAWKKGGNRIEKVMKFHKKLNESEKLLAQFCEECQSFLTNLANAIEKYREIAAKTNERQPLVKRKEPQNKYPRPKILQPFTLYHNV